MIHREIKSAIFSSSLKKASDLDEISFLILQKSYHAIFDLFYKIFFELKKMNIILSAEKKASMRF